jgi:phosphatidylserine decarboxylase
MIKYLFLITSIIVAILLFFYRKPTILSFNESNKILRGPCFGKVMLSEFNKKDNTFIISIFLSVKDIHWQLNPIDGIIDSVTYDNTGKFNLAFDYNKSKDNEKNITIYNTNNGRIKLYQIAGLLARRISTYIKPGDYVKKGDIMGLIKLGSRVDLIIEQGQRFKSFVKKNDYINGSNTILGTFI